MDQVIGSCSVCGGEVVAHVGAWWSVLPPPPAHCRGCGASESRGPVIQMKPRERHYVTDAMTGTNGFWHYRQE